MTAMTPAQISFLSALETGEWASYRSETAWDMPDGTVIAITRAEVIELERMDLVGNLSRFRPDVVINDWWSSRITDAGLQALENAKKPPTP